MRVVGASLLLALSTGRLSGLFLTAAASALAAVLEGRRTRLSRRCGRELQVEGGRLFHRFCLQCQLCRLTRLSKAFIAALGSAPRSLLPVGLELLKRRLSAVALKGMG